jgi:hypothetical protein
MQPVTDRKVAARLRNANILDGGLR